MELVFIHYIFKHLTYHLQKMLKTSGIL